jgi:hypothetical protein
LVANTRPALSPAARAASMSPAASPIIQDEARSAPSLEIKEFSIPGLGF